MFFPTTLPGSSVASPQEIGLVSPPGLGPITFLSPASAFSKAKPDKPPDVSTPDAACFQTGPPQGMENLGSPFHCQQAQPGAGKEQPSRDHGYPSSCAPPTTLILTDTRGMSPWHQEARAEQPLTSPALPCQGGRGTWHGDSPVMAENGQVQQRKIRRAWSTAEHGEPAATARHCEQPGQLWAGTTHRALSTLHPPR